MYVLGTTDHTIDEMYEKEMSICDKKRIETMVGLCFVFLESYVIAVEEKGGCIKYEISEIGGRTRIYKKMTNKVMYKRKRSTYIPTVSNTACLIGTSSHQHI